MTQHQQAHNDFYFTVYSYIEAGKSPKQIAETLGYSKQKLNYYIRALKANNLIKMIGKGVWETNQDIPYEKPKLVKIVKLDNPVPSEIIKIFPSIN